MLQIWARLEDPYAAPTAPDTGPAPAYRPPSTLAFSGRPPAAVPPQAARPAVSAARMPASSTAVPAKAQVSPRQAAQLDHTMLNSRNVAHRHTHDLHTLRIRMCR